MKQRIGHTEFLEWLVFLEKQETERDFKYEHYQAQIAAEVCKTRVLHPERIRTEDFVLKVRYKEPDAVAPADKPKMTEAQHRSKNAWAAHLQIDMKKHKRKQAAKNKK